MFDLVVTKPFGDYARGSRITDAAAVEAALKDYANNVVRVAKPKEPAKAPPKSSK